MKTTESSRNLNPSYPAYYFIPRFVSFLTFSSSSLQHSSSPFLHLHMFSSAVLCFSKSLLRMQNFPFIFKILYPSFTTNLFNFIIDLQAASTAGKPLSSRLVKTMESGSRGMQQFQLVASEKHSLCMKLKFAVYWLPFLLRKVKSRLHCTLEQVTKVSQYGSTALQNFTNFSVS